MALFTLSLSDGTETLDFLGSTLKVMDGGFDIGTVETERELIAARPGFYIPIKTNRTYRIATIRFEVRGATRKAVIQEIGKIEKMLRGLDARQRVTAGKRAQLTYAWDGADNVTYFEAFAGDVRYPADALSVDKAHRKIAGEFAVPECELTLYLSAEGYKLSIFSDSVVELPLSTLYTARTTGGVPVEGPGYKNTGTWVPKANYVQILGTDIDGFMPAITKISLYSASAAFKTLYMGLQQTPFPTNIFYDSVDYTDGGGFTFTIANAAATKGSYREHVVGGAEAVVVNDLFASAEWSVNNGSAGIFFSFLHGFNNNPVDSFFAIGISDYVDYGVVYHGDFIGGDGLNKILPLGIIQIPPGGYELINQGTIHPNLYLGLYTAYKGPITLNMDFVSMLPIGNGLRVWRNRLGTAKEGYFVDDDWRGIQYRKDSSNYVSNSFVGLMNPLRLEPGVDQRIYLDGQSGNFTMRVYAVPTFSTLAY